jgi:tetratricopeptide (TPR) repeat protein
MNATNGGLQAFCGRCALGIVMRKALPFFTAVLLAGLSASAVNAQSSADTEICTADDKSATSPEQRIAACTTLVEVFKDQPKELAGVLVHRGAVYYFINRMPLAFADLDRAIALDPTNANALRERSNAHRTAGRLDRALTDANEAIRLAPDDAKMFDNRGNVFNNNRQYDRAIEDYNEAIRLDPSYAQAWRDRGVAYYFKQDYANAIKNYDEAIRLEPTSARAFTNRGAAYKKMGRNDRALLDDSEAIRLDPRMPEYFDNRGLSYAANGDYDRAIADYNEAIRITPQANFLTNRGDAYNQKRDYDRAIADYDRALQLNPGFALAYNNRGAAHRRKGDLDRAIENYEQALRNPHMDSAAENLAAVRQERDRRGILSNYQTPTFNCRTAKRAVEKAICSDPDLSRLDRQIDDAYKAAQGRLDRKTLGTLRAEQRDFVNNRNKSFGRPEYNLKREMEKRFYVLRGLTASN